MSMRFTTRSYAQKYVFESPKRLRDRMHVVGVKVWDSTRCEWLDRYDVIIVPGDSRPRSKHNRRKNNSQIFCK